VKLTIHLPLVPR